MSPRREPELIDISATLKAETDKAWLLYDGSREEWVPRSQVDNSDNTQKYGTGIWVMPVWLARDKGFI